MEQMSPTNDETQAKKQELVLQLDRLATKRVETGQIEGDQTPTPIRFIRNCEEVGLFQDLQNNPFDEIFKKAVEKSKGLSLPEVNHDESSLHTPHILPVERANATNEKNGGESVKRADGHLKIVARDATDEHLKRKRSVVSSKEQIREMNRIAQLRCRKKKKLEQKKLNQDMDNLRSINKKLLAENETLREKLNQLLKILDHVMSRSSIEGILKAQEIVQIRNQMAEIRPQSSAIRQRSRVGVSRAQRVVPKMPGQIVAPTVSVNPPVLAQVKSVLIRSVPGVIRTVAVSELPPAATKVLSSEATDGSVTRTESQAVVPIQPSVYYPLVSKNLNPVLCPSVSSNALILNTFLPVRRDVIGEVAAVTKSNSK